MEINKTKQDGMLTVVIDGKIDTATSPAFLKFMDDCFEQDKDAQKIELDLAKVRYISSAGIRVLLHSQKQVNSKKITMVLSHVSPDVMEVLELTGFVDILTIV